MFHENGPTMSLRKPAVAGMFYPSDADELRRQLDGMVPRGPRRRALGVIAPHAGYVYSGGVAGAAYGAVEVPSDVVILCFNHGGEGADFAVWPEGAWRTPLGDAPVNASLAKRIKESFPEAEYDEAGHLGEHSGEVQVPFLQHVRPDVRIAPVAVTVRLRDGRLEEFGVALAGIPGDFLVVASTDLNHFEDQETTLRKDEAVIRAIERLDGEGLREAIISLNVSMCGYAPTLVLMAYARARGASEARAVARATSAAVSGDYGKVVGYVGMIVPCGSSGGRIPAGS